MSVMHVLSSTQVIRLKMCKHFSSCSYACCMSHPSNHPFIWHIVKVMKLPITVFSPASCHFLSLIGPNILLSMLVSNLLSRMICVRGYSNLGTSCAAASFSYGLFNVTGISFIYTVVTTEWLISNELKMMWQEVLMAKFKVLSARTADSQFHSGF